MTRSLLFLSYLFPPRGGAGVQRAMKFVKYLPQFAWRPLVIAGQSGPADNVTTIQDPTLLKDLPPESLVTHAQLTAAEQRCRMLLHPRLLQRLSPTDPIGWWVEPAIRAARSLLARHDVRAIFVTMSPFSAARAGMRLKCLTRLPLILDLRDPWALDETRIYPTRWHARRDWCAMAQALAAADLVIMNTPESAAAVRKSFRLPAKTRIIALTNGFDAEDFALHADPHPLAPAPPDVLRIVHTGMFHTDQALVWDDLLQGRGWLSRFKTPRRPINLWTRTPRYLLKAMEQLARSGRISRTKLQLVLVGELTSADKALVYSSPVADMVRMTGYQTHEQSIRWLQAADVLFLPLHTPQDGGPALVVPGKTYEYLASGRPILAMGPPGDMRQMVQESGCGNAIDGQDIAAAANALAELYQAKLAGRLPGAPDPAFLQRFERRELTRRLAQELDQTLERLAASQARTARPPTQPSALSPQH